MVSKPALSRQTLQHENAKTAALRPIGVSDGIALLMQLDACLAGSASDLGPGWDAGLAAATRLNALLMQHHLVWDDVIGAGSRLAKLCGRLGSDYEAERASAYGHAVRLIRRRETNWSALVLLPHPLPNVPGPAEISVLPPTEAPPEENWIVTVRRLNRRAAWRTDTEHIFLESLEHGLSEGHAIVAAEARWLRDIWWDAELNNPEPEDAFE
jgi:hypothetical protein